ncbi:hypothetical protein KLM55_14330 [Clostridioides difficile]|nr:hypothetical protein [Clostridioides difficile]EIS9421938.1 hypothetical protein [Clostridioides difficile]EIS9443412.1 hypothetical protein [Clostridioides difficile]MBG0296093.1 hypothetical protein [Clostridioides difficile]MBH6895389.1 hypothetical protein [Clostridioides difficile]MBH7252614.1 hypothetical protein [Clostridioides difficile]
MRFEIGKTYKFDKEKFMEINGVEQYKEYKELLMMAMFAIQMNFGLILV